MTRMQNAIRQIEIQMTDLVDLIVEDDRWRELALETLCEGAAIETLRHLGIDPAGFEICVMACNDARIAELNADFRDKSAATNVLSWPSAERAAATPGAAPDAPLPDPTGMPVELGDIAIAYETCAREAKAADKPLADHVTHLIVHASLHLLGYDHVHDKDATLMEGIETQILATMGLSDPYSQ